MLALSSTSSKQQSDDLSLKLSNKKVDILEKVERKLVKKNKTKVNYNKITAN